MQGRELKQHISEVEFFTRWIILRFFTNYIPMFRACWTGYSVISNCLQEKIAIFMYQRSGIYVLCRWIVCSNCVRQYGITLTHSKQTSMKNRQKEILSFNNTFEQCGQKDELRLWWICQP